MFNPVELEVMWNRFITILDEQAKTLIRTAYSNTLSDSRDLSAGLFDSKGNMIAQANIGTPGHINTMALGVRHFLERHPKHTINPGDVLISNNPYEISGHLLDVTIVTPAFLDNEIIGYFASTCHVVDIGGRGFNPEADNIFEEGLYIPYMKYYKNGKINQELQVIIENNVQAPYEVLGDLRAQVIAQEVAIRGLMGMLDEFNLNEIDSIGNELISRSEVAMRKAISDLPNGIFENEVLTDGIGEPIKLKCSVTIRDDEISVDFNGSSPASPKGINCSLYYTLAYVTYALKATIAPDIPNNEGSFRPVNVTAPKNSIVNASFPSPTAGRHVVGHFAPVCVLGALHQVIPKKVIAEGSTAVWNIQVQGEDLNGKNFSYIMFSNGGMGARSNKDGLSATGFPSGVTGTPVEIVESTSPIIFYKKELSPDSGGSGHYQGGLGQTIRFGVRTKKSFRFPTLYDRTEYPAQGLEGGKPGTKGEVLLNDKEPLEPKKLYNLKPTDIITLKLPGGGGYGNPEKRDSQSVLEDVINGYISLEKAKSDYGLIIESTLDGMKIKR